MQSCSNIRCKINSKLVELSVANAQIKQERKALVDGAVHLVHQQAALVICQTVAKQVQEEAHRKITDIVTSSLKAVFAEPYLFKIKFAQKRGRTEAELVFERNGMEVDPMTASGGGVVDLAALALRLSCIMLSRPPKRRLVVLDEPLKHLSADHLDKVRDLLAMLAEKLQFQFVIVSHATGLALGKVVEL